MELFTGKESVEESLVVAFGLEGGLKDFYLSMEKKSPVETARSLFTQLAKIETVHQGKLVDLYNELTGSRASQEDFSESIVSPALEGGMTTQEYLSRFNPDLSSIIDIVSMAMGIEAQALDLYQRASGKVKDKKARQALQQIADEERTHLQYLADYLDQNAS
ncbi:Rubrerythrin [Desulforhopalus singaporensis]|nr:Rubrerythrin [Desulforhopalus singaporensis]